MGILVIALSINPRPLSALELKLSGLIMESRVDTAGDNQNTHVIISNYPHDGRADKRHGQTPVIVTLQAIGPNCGQIYRGKFKM